MMRNARILVHTLCLLGVAGLQGCAMVRSIPPSVYPGPLPTALMPLTQPGRHLVDWGYSTFDFPSGCRGRIERYMPSGSATPRATVVLAHGFMRNAASMRGWGWHWASHGIPTLVVEFCQGAWFSGQHQRNAADLFAIANAMIAGDVIYAGFSAGGLAAMRAADRDRSAFGLLALDPVLDGRVTERCLTARMACLIVLGADTRCNRAGLVRRAVVAAEAPVVGGVLQVPYAGHCQFELPQDRRCAWVCGRFEPKSLADRYTVTLLALTTAWLVADVLPSPNHARLWQDAVDGLRRSGLIELMAD